MQRLRMLGAALAVVAILGSCARAPEDVGRSAAIYSAVIKHWGPDGRHGLVVEAICDGAEEADRGSCEPMSDELRVALAHLLGPGYRFVQDPDLGPDYDGDAYFWVGPISGDGDRVTVPTSYFCGAACAAGMTAVVERSATGWRVTGGTGSSWIS